MSYALFQQVSFEHPWWLWCLCVWPVVWWWHQRQAPLALPMSLPNVRLPKTWRHRLLASLPYFTLLGGGFLILAIAGPTRHLEEQNISTQGIDIMLVMDVSQSMLALDFEPNRLEASKEVAAEFVNQRPYDRIGLVLFAGDAYTACPITADHNVLQTWIQQIHYGYLVEGTAIGMGLATAVNRIKEGLAKEKVLILLTDGDNVQGYIDPMTAAQLAKNYGIRTYTIGVGTEGEALVPTGTKSDGTYYYGLSKVTINEPLLKKIAETTGGQYFRATTKTDLQGIYHQIDALEKTEMTVTAIKTKRLLFRRCLAWGLLLLLSAAILKRIFVPSLF